MPLNFIQGNLKYNDNGEFKNIILPADRAYMNEVITVSQTQPTSPDNKIWIDSSQNVTGIEVPTVVELNATLGKAFTVTLTVAGWVENAQTVSSADFIASGYAYIVSPTSASFDDYTTAGIYADNVTTTGNMTFHCSEEPESALVVNVMRMVSI